MPGNPAVRVGILVFIALVAFTAVAVFLTGYRTRVSGYPIVVTFDDAQGITTGSEVRMAGVTIGTVDKVTLDRNQRAVMRLLINNKYSIPVGSEFVLRIGLLIGDKFIDIVPKRGVHTYYKTCARIKGVVPPRPEELIPKISKVLDNLNTTTTNINNLLGNRKFQERLGRTLSNLERATARLDRTLATIQGTIVTNQDEVQAIICNVLATSENLRSFTEQLSGIAKSGKFQGDLGATLQAARHAAESLERSTTSLESLVTSPELQQDVRQTVKEARATVEQAHAVINRVSGLLGVGPTGKPGEAAPVTGAKLNIRRPSLEALFRPDDSNLRITGYINIPQRSNRYLRLGVYDIGNTNKGILQFGHSVDPDTDLRYGLYASKLGISADHVFAPRIYGTANVYDPNRIRLDLQAGYQVTDNWGLLVGIDKVFRDNQLTVGARFTR